MIFSFCLATSLVYGFKFYIINLNSHLTNGSEKKMSHLESISIFLFLPPFFFHHVNQQSFALWMLRFVSGCKLFASTLSRHYYRNQLMPWNFFLSFIVARAATWTPSTTMTTELFLLSKDDENEKKKGNVTFRPHWCTHKPFERKRQDDFVGLPATSL